MSELTKSLDEIGFRYASDKPSHIHNYLRHYDFYFSRLRETPVKLLELGVNRGDSLQTWRDYFPYGDITGVDLDPNCIYQGDRIRSVVGHQSDAILLRQLEEQFGPFDIIVDDGSHFGLDQRNSFELLYPKLNLGGYYVIEDVFTSYWDWGPSFTEYVKETYLDLLLWAGKVPPHGKAGDFRRHFSKEECEARCSLFELETKSMHFSPGLIFFEKFTHEEYHRWKE